MPARPGIAGGTPSASLLAAAFQLQVQKEQIYISLRLVSGERDDEGTFFLFFYPHLLSTLSCLLLPEKIK